MPIDKNEAFTLLELIIVIIIVGILATLGLTTYTTQVEYGRTAEAKANIAAMRKLAYEYFLKNGTLATVTAADLGVGTNGLPNVCRSTHYYLYSFQNATSSRVYLYAYRCTTGSGGKTPDWSGHPYLLQYYFYPLGGAPYETRSYDYTTGVWVEGYKVPPF
ncbi:MAG: prepilin-type N-terminal cleavage/methylation domain-containing protein [Candidatus Omnitrophica bacterium]|nr:prepilin-type N-terminal cleavage/methylation domain-containing protein [Candidatus Omnitrophota bacterium]